MPDNPSSSKNAKNRRSPQSEPKRSKSVIIWLGIFISFLIAAQLLWQRQEDVIVSYSQFLKYVESENIEQVVIRERQMVGRLRQSATATIGGAERSFKEFVTVIPFEDPDLVKSLIGKNVKVVAEQETTNWAGYLIAALPWVFLIGFWVFMFRQMQSGQRGMFSFGKSRAKLLTGDRPTVTFEDVAGVEEAKRDLQEIVEFLKNPGKFQALGGRIPKGALLLGPPGTGKTLLARAVAGEAGVPFFSMSGSDFVEMFVGVGASRVRDLFEQARQNAPCIIFIDEIDAIGRHRGAGLGGGHDEREQTLNQLLVGLDGFETTDTIIVLGATNRPDVLDPALLRPGRFDRHIVVDRPDVTGREKILSIHIRNQKIPVEPSVRLDVLAKGVPGMVGADLANLVNEAALLAARFNRPAVTAEDFEEAKEKILMGAKRQLVISPEEKRVVAYHEAGHALAYELIPEIDPLHKVSILPQGRGLGVTISLQEERYLHSRSYCMGTMAAALGGRVAEELVFGEVTSGAQNDIEQVTRIGRHMVCDWGMSEQVGATALGEKEHEVFLGRDIARRANYSETTAHLIDQEMRRFVDEAEDRVRSLLTQHIDKLHAVAEALLERDSLTRDEVAEIIGVAEPPDLPAAPDDSEPESVEKAAG
ncbi:MAG: ATP-dependent zinc metalloprotease FtsH [candidate division Zixibacteria bacterium]|nr:ATP-dependent zinc metalloprotease FtsH [candidate division Zixibacteria bacterium]